MYAYPTNFRDEFIEALAETPRILKYINIPLQHASDRMLTAIKDKNAILRVGGHRNHFHPTPSGRQLGPSIIRFVAEFKTTHRCECSGTGAANATRILGYYNATRILGYHPVTMNKLLTEITKAP